MSWCLVRDPAGFSPSHREASDALKAFRDARDREEAIAAGQMDMFGEGEA